MTAVIQEVMQSACFGCGAQNEQGLQIKSVWDGEVARCDWTPQPYHIGGPDFVHGGIIASVMDCHCAAAAMYAKYTAEGKEPGVTDRYYYVTATLNMRYLRPTPIGKVLNLEARVDKLEGRKAYVRCSLFVEGEECASCTALFVRPKGSEPSDE